MTLDDFIYLLNIASATLFRRDSRGFFVSHGGVAIIAWLRHTTVYINSFVSLALANNPLIVYELTNQQ